MQTVIILGTGGNSVEILDAIHAVNNVSPTYLPMGFLDDNQELTGREIFQIPVLGPLDKAMEFADVLFVNGIGNQHNHWKRGGIVDNSGLPLHRFVSIVHPSASVSSLATIGRGTVIFQNVTVCARVVIGNHVLILPNSVVSHETVVEDHACIAGGACISGGCRIGSSAYIGSNATIREHLRIGPKALVGMGAVVIRDVEENTVVAGCPAKHLRNQPYLSETP